MKGKVITVTIGAMKQALIQGLENVRTTIINDYNDKNKKYTYEEFMEQCNKILSGGTTAIDEKINMELILDAIEKINAKGEINLEEEFRDWINKGHGVVSDNSILAKESDW